jgi:hypothetical protein
MLTADINTHVLFMRSKVISSRNARSIEIKREDKKTRHNENERIPDKKNEKEAQMQSREKDHEFSFSTRWDKYLSLSHTR